MTLLPDGKLPTQLLQELLTKLAIDDVKVTVGPSPGEDAAAIDRGDHYLLLAADPITFLPKRIGWYAVQVNANDIAAMGGTMGTSPTPRIPCGLPGLGTSTNTVSTNGRSKDVGIR